MTKLFAIAIPVLPGKTEEVKQFMADLMGPKHEDFKNSRKDLGVRERSAFQSTPNGDLVVVTLEGENPEEAFTKFAAKDDEFSKWFAQKVKEIHGFDINNPPAGPLPEMIVDSEA